MPLWVQDFLMRPVLKMAGMIEPWEGTQTTLHCLLDDSIMDNSGSFYSQLGLYSDSSFNKGGWPMSSPNKDANDDKVAERLWTETEKLVGLA